jgi:hypothetical protein
MHPTKYACLAVLAGLGGHFLARGGLAWQVGSEARGARGASHTDALCASLGGCWPLVDEANYVGKRPPKRVLCRVLPNNARAHALFI